MRLNRVTRPEEKLVIGFPAHRFLDELFADWPFQTMLQNWNENWRPSVDILEKDGNLVLRAEVPGIEEKEIEVNLEGNVLTIKGERRLDESEKNGYRRAELSYGSFSRSFTLPETVDSEKIKAEYRNGILTITVPQKPEVRPRAIPVAVH